MGGTIEGLLSFFRFDKYESSVSQSRIIRLREYPPLFRAHFSKEYIKNNILSESLTIKDYILEVDSNGFIIPSKIHKSTNFDIVFMGGSTVECAFMAQNKRFPYIVGRKLESITKMKINSYNGGVSGNNSLHSLNILLNKIVPMQPKCVFMMHNINDLAILYYTKTY
jgi:hypothetical protein